MQNFGFCKKLEAIFILRFRSVLCSVHCPKNKLNKNRACHADLSVYCWFMFQATQARDISSSRDKLCWYAGSDYFWDSMTFYTLSQRESIFRDICIIRNVAGKTRYYAEYMSQRYLVIIITINRRLLNDQASTLVQYRVWVVQSV